MSTEFIAPKEALERLRSLPLFHLEISPVNALMLVSQLQLALRHPENKGEAAHQMKGLALLIQGELMNQVPELSNLLNAGWHPEFDVKADTSAQKPKPDSSSPFELKSTDLAFPGSIPEDFCVCSRCRKRIEERVPVYYWTTDGNWMWKYHAACLGFQTFDEDEDDFYEENYFEEEQVGGVEPDTDNSSLIPNFYRPPHGLPLNWRDEVSGKLKDAVELYINYSVYKRTYPYPTQEQLKLVVDYLTHHINAPCWSDSPELQSLRSSVKELKTVEDISSWLMDCVQIGLDPL